MEPKNNFIDSVQSIIIFKKNRAQFHNPDDKWLNERSCELRSILEKSIHMTKKLLDMDFCVKYPDMAARIRETLTRLEKQLDDVDQMMGSIEKELKLQKCRNICFRARYR